MGACSTYGEEKRFIQGFGRERERGHLEDPRVDGKIILRWIVRKCNVGVWTASIWLSIGAVGGHL